VTIPIVHSAHFAFILSGASEALYERDMRVVLCPTQHEHDREVDLLGRLMQGTTDGALLILPEESRAELEALRRDGFPFVVVDPRGQVPDGIPVVATANAAGAAQATRHLLDLGHRRIGIVTGRRGWTATEDRRIGYHSALAEAGVMPDAELEVEGDWLIESGRTGAGRLLDAAAPPTAIFAFNDNIGVGVLQAAKARGLRVPEDLSVVGFDDTEQAPIVTPALTTVRQPLAEMGRTAVSILARLIDGRRVEGLRADLATRLVARESTAPPRR
jgi:LacI family transcriptional regulator